MNYIFIPLVLLVLVCFSACTTSKTKRFIHEVTHSFGVKDFDIENPKYNIFKSNGVLFTPSVKSINYDEYSVGFGFYAQSIKSINLKYLYIDDEKFEINERVEIDFEKKYGVYEGILRIANMNNNKLYELSEKGDIKFKLCFEIDENNTSEKCLAFKIKKITEKRFVFST